MAEKAKLSAKKTDLKRKSTLKNQRIDYLQSLHSPFNTALNLQTILGNQIVQRLLKSRVMQAKLIIGQTNDKYELEADRVADSVMRMDAPDNIESEGKKEFLRTEEIPGQTTDTTPNLESHIHVIKEGGQPLPESVRSYFEPRFGYDFNQVRCHTNTHANKSSRAINALAYTVGRNIVFGFGQYAPHTPKGRHLLAHELTHVVQQGAMQSKHKQTRLPCIRTKKCKVMGNLDFKRTVAIQRQAAPPAPPVVSITIQRDTETGNSTTGTLTVGAHNLFSLELPDRGNAATNNSATAGRIPAGVDNAHVRTDGGNWRLQLQGVPGRNLIQIHTGNIPDDSTGCILPGTSRGVDVVNNSATARNLIQQEVNTAGPGAIIQVTIIDPPVAPVPAPAPAPAPVPAPPG
jgi:hypothetical protein